MITICLLTTFLLAFQDGEPQINQKPVRQWRTPIEIAEQVRSLELVTTSTIGYSKNGLPIQCIEVARDGVIPVDTRSAVLVVAGIDGNHLLGTEVATDMITALLGLPTEVTASLLEEHKLYVIPQVNPDAAALYFESIKNEQQRNLTSSDNDHDGVKDEDGGEDLNGDGFITKMRVPDLEKATHLADPDETRLHIEPDPLKGQAASFILYPEGIDNDGDGKYNEDGLGGVDLNKNFMHGYKEHGDGSGHWQLSESESKALADFVLQHQEIAAIIVYGHHDTLSKPFTESGKDNAGAPKKLAEGDVELYKLISEKFLELTELNDVVQSSWDGSFVAWSYAQYGVPSFSTPLWSRPDPIEEEQKEKATPETSEAKPTGDEGSREGRGRGGIDRQEMMAEFDTNGDGELSEDERAALRESMQDRFGGGGRPSGGHPGGGGRRPSNSNENRAESSDNSNLTPSGVGNISQETLDELLKAAEAAGFPVDDGMMAEITPEQVEQYAKMSGIKIRRVTKGNTNTASSKEDVAWLAYSDDQRNGEGFVEWTTFEHPQLGTVEIGGWVPYFKTLPPTDAIDSITEKQAKFIIEIASRLPDVRLGSPIIEQLANGLWEVRISVVNDGWFPTGTAMAKKNKRARPFVLRLDVPNDAIVSGQKVNRIWSLAGGGSRTWFKWVVQGKPNVEVNITLFSDKFGTKTIPITLKETTGEKS
ncbi:MAG: hypothetical protein HOC27_06725 [Phycisphaerae bacterium]|jgi:hypothetical protein|nr:hypothetical protein [Phycisphaerae bacterium]